MHIYSNKALWLFLAIIVIISLGIAGCGAGNSTPAASNSPTPTLTSTTSPTETAVLDQTSTPLSTTASPTPTTSDQDIITNAVNAFSKLTSYQYTLSMTMDMSGTIAGMAQDYSLNATGDGVNDITGKKMQMNLNMDVSVPNQGKMTIPMAMYYVDGWEYINVNVPLTGDQWLKMETDNSSFDSQDQSQQALDMLQSAVKTTVTGTEEVDGVSCYVIQIDPDLSVLSEWLKSFQQTTNLQENDTANIDLSKFVKNLSIQEWITKDSYILKKSVISATIAIAGETPTSVTPTDTTTGNSLTMDISQTTEITQVNQPVTVTLPPEAEQAQEVTNPQ